MTFDMTMAALVDRAGDRQDREGVVQFTLCRAFLWVNFGELRGNFVE
jgi:hypothetical protein